jgi:hypothetical protein
MSQDGNKHRSVHSQPRSRGGRARRRLLLGHAEPDPIATAIEHKPVPELIAQTASERVRRSSMRRRCTPTTPRGSRAINTSY